MDPWVARITWRGRRKMERGRRTGMAIMCTFSYRFAENCTIARFSFIFQYWLDRRWVRSLCHFICKIFRKSTLVYFCKIWLTNQYRLYDESDILKQKLCNFRTFNFDRLLCSNFEIYWYLVFAWSAMFSAFGSVRC